MLFILFLPLVNGDVTASSSRNLGYGNDTYTTLPAGSYSSVYRKDGVWYVDGAVYPSPAPSITPTPTPGITPPSLDSANFMQYFYQADFLGFLQAYFLSALAMIDIVYGLISMLFLVPLYIKTRNLTLLGIVWILLGSIFIVGMQSVSMLSIFFLAFGIASVLYKLFKGGS